MLLSVVYPASGVSKIIVSIATRFESACNWDHGIILFSFRLSVLAFHIHGIDGLSPFSIYSISTLRYITSALSKLGINPIH